MKETMLYLCIIISIYWITYLYFHWKCIRHYAKTTLSEPNPRDVICLVIKKE